MIYLLTEKEFTFYPWCQRIEKGLWDEVRKKRTAIEEIEYPEQATVPNSCILLVGATGDWIKQMCIRAVQNQLKPVLLGNHTASMGLYAGAVVMDLADSMRVAVDYLHKLGRCRLALFGVNPDSASDASRMRHFCEMSESENHVFFLRSTIKETFCEFYQKASAYDGVICVSDYAAVYLVRQLKARNYQIPDKLYIIGYGDTFLSQLSEPSVTSISDGYENFGRAGLSICSLIEKNEAASSTHIYLHGGLHIRQSTENRPYLKMADSLRTSVNSQGNLFYQDLDMSTYARLEIMFSQCDDTDFLLLQLLPEKLTYAAMAEKCFISETAAKYRIKKMKTICDAESRSELLALLNGIRDRAVEPEKLDTGE